jgi:prepilin-type N-terminal cleavage/methylation domain-containing protein
MYNNKCRNKPNEFETKTLFTSRLAFTLVELLVVMSIMVLLVAASVPMLKPMLESQKTRNAAETVAAALQRVRFKAMEEQASCGIQLVPFETEQNVSLQMRLIKQANNLLNSSDYRAQIINGNIYLYAYNSPNWVRQTNATDSAWVEWNQYVQPGYEVQFGHQGRFYKLATATTLDAPYDNLTLPEDANVANTTVSNALEYKVIQPPRTTLIPPVVLPRGTVIDLAFSAGCIAPEDPDPTKYNHNKLFFNGPNPPQIMFTPSGYVDYFNGTYNPFYGGLIYFCIGEWERGLNLAEDGKNNIETMTNFWVTIHPQTGQVRITEMAPHNSDPTKTPQENARKFAAEHFGLSD